MIANEALILAAARIILENYLKEGKIFLSLIPESSNENPPKETTGGGPYSKKKPHWTQTAEGKEKMSLLSKKQWKENREKMIKATHPDK